MTLRKTARSTYGFTILEMLIVLLISAIVITVLGTVLSSSFRMLRTGETRSQLQATARGALEYLADNIGSANMIPRSQDRDYNFVDDANLSEFGIDATYVVGEPDSTDPDIHWYPAGTQISEAWMDRIVTQQRDDMTLDIFGRVNNVKQVQPSLAFEFNGQRVSSVTSIFGLAIPARDNMIYYLSDNLHNGQYNGADVEFPHTFSAKNRSESCVLYQKMHLDLKSYGTGNTGVSGDPTVSTAQFDIPIASNITRVQFEYFHRVPLWLPDPNDSTTAYLEDTNDDGDVDSPVLTGWMLVPIDVSDNEKSNWSYNDIFRSPSVSAADRVDAFNNWNIEVFYNEPDPDSPHNAPYDFYGWLDNGTYANFEFQVEDILGFDNGAALAPDWNEDFGNCDGIPDGDGVPDNPVPAWWMPYLEAIRITIVTTPTSTIEERTEASGTVRDQNGNFVYYNLDSPIPYADFNRTIPLVSASTLYIGDGKDVVVSRMVYPELSYKMSPTIYPDDTKLLNMRRADYNYRLGSSAAFIGGVPPIDEGGPISPRDRYYELEAYDDRN
jgi:prepilin-type N-terminal cleavage/methylation domain-containing protein